MLLEVTLAAGFLVWTGVPGVVMTHKAASVCGAVLISVVGIAAGAHSASAVPAPLASLTRAPVPARGAVEAAVNPVLTRAPAQAMLDPNQPTVVSLGVDHVAAGASVRLEGEAYVYTFGREALTASHAHVVDLAITGVEPGVYMVSIANPDGRRSGSLPLVLKAR
jgi:hypothetical protein